MLTALLAVALLAEPATPPVELHPYGLLATTFFYDSFPVNSADLPVAAMPGNGGAFGATARQSRLGLDAKLGAVAQALGARSADAKAELDFFGGYYPGAGNTFFAPMPRLRLFYATLRFDAWSVEAGQDWSLFAPLNPDTPAHLAVTEFSGSGNIWARLPQVRVEGRSGVFSLAAALLAPADNAAAGSDPVAVFLAPNAGNLSRRPAVEARVTAAPQLLGQPASIGLSGHYGGEAVSPAHGNGPGDLVTSWGAAIDAVLPAGRHFALKGEAYSGADLDGFFSFAAVTPASAGAATKDAAATPARGGWAQVALKGGAVALYAGLGEELSQQPDADHQFGAKQIERNLTASASATWAFAPKSLVGLEVERIETTRFGRPTAPANHLDLAVQVGF